MQTEYLNGAELKAMFQAASSWLGVNKEAIDALNVFPVPDGDTGTNMYLTLMAAVREVEKLKTDSVAKVAEAASHGALMGARGNSGVILSQLLRGFARQVSGKDTINAEELARGLVAASQKAYQAVMKPIEGTILTVAREAANEAMAAAKKGGNILAVLQANLLKAEQTLAQTPRMLAVLREAGVVDAGGKGLVVALEGALRVLQGGGQVNWDSVAAEKKQEDLAASQKPKENFNITAKVVDENVSLEFHYCTEFLLRGRDLPLDQIRRKLTPLGDCLLVVGEPELAKIHVHTNHPGEVLEYCGKLGDMLEIAINNMVEQSKERTARLEEKNHQTQGSKEVAGLANVANARAAGNKADNGKGGKILPLRSANRPLAAPAEATARRPAPSPVKEIGVVTVVVGDGLQKIFTSLGADTIVQGGQTMNPSTEELLQAVESVNASKIFILPNNGNVVMTAGQVKELTKKEVVVIPTKTIPQGLSAMVAFDSSRGVPENQAAMVKTVEGVKTGEITYAVRNSKFNGVEISEMDIIGLFDGQIKAVGKKINEVAGALLKQMVDGRSEVISIYYGHDVDAKEAQDLLEKIRRDYPGREVELHAGGQPLYYYILSVE